MRANHLPRRLIASAAAVLLGLTVTPLPAAHARDRGRPRCRVPAGSAILADGPAAQILTHGAAAPFEYSQATYTACVKASGRKYVLLGPTNNNPDSETGALAAAVGGPFAALAQFTTSAKYQGSSIRVVVHDLRTGRIATALGSEAVSCDFQCSSGADRLAVNAAGFTVVHLTVRSDFPSSPGTGTAETIQVSDSHGVRTVDSATHSSPSPVLTDLALSGDTVSWRHDGTRDTATLS